MHFRPASRRLKNRSAAAPPPHGWPGHLVSGRCPLRSDDDDRDDEQRRRSRAPADGFRGGASGTRCWLLRGEDLETVSRALSVTAATLTAWRDAFLAAGEASLASRPADGGALEGERLKARLGETSA